MATTTIDYIKNVIFDWCELVLNGKTIKVPVQGSVATLDLIGSLILPASLNVPVERSHTGEAVLDSIYMSVAYTPEKYENNGIDVMKMGIDTDYNHETPAVAPTYSNNTHLTESTCWLELAEVNGDGGLLNLLKMTQEHPLVLALFDAYGMGLQGFEGGIQAVPYKVKASYYEKSVMTLIIGIVDGITFHQNFFRDISGSYGIQNAAGATIITGTYTTENE